MAKKKTPKEASQLFENIMKASVKPKAKKMTVEEAKIKSETLQNMVDGYYIFNEGVAKVISVKPIEVSNGYDVQATGELVSIHKTIVRDLASNLKASK